MIFLYICIHHHPAEMQEFSLKQEVGLKTLFEGHLIIVHYEEKFKCSVETKHIES